MGKVSRNQVASSSGEWYDEYFRVSEENTNAEIIGIAVDRMNTDALGGTAITDASEAALDPSTVFVHTQSKTNITAGEGQVQINKDVFSSGY